MAIPVLNGARYLDEVLGAVRAQRVDAAVEILVVDSGSSDGSPEIARRHGAVVHEVAPEEFSHGGTRNLSTSLRLQTCSVSPAAIAGVRRRHPASRWRRETLYRQSDL